MLDETGRLIGGWMKAHIAPHSEPRGIDHEWVDAGGLFSYGVNFPAIYRRVAEYVDKIAKGAKAADLPIEQPTKFELVLNLKTAKAIGITISPAILVRADDVIE